MYTIKNTMQIRTSLNGDFVEVAGGDGAHVIARVPLHASLGRSAAALVAARAAAATGVRVGAPVEHVAWRAAFGHRLRELLVSLLQRNLVAERVAMPCQSDRI